MVMFHWEAVTYLPYQLLPRGDQSSCYSSCLTMLTQCKVHADQLHSIICRHGMLSVLVKIEPDHDTWQRFHVCWHKQLGILCESCHDAVWWVASPSHMTAMWLHEDDGCFVSLADSTQVKERGRGYGSHPSSGVWVSVDCVWLWACLWERIPQRCNALVTTNEITNIENIRIMKKRMAVTYLSR